MIHGRSWRGGPGERELRDLSPAEGTTRPDFFWVAYTSRRSVSLRLVYADGSPCGGRHAQGCSWGPYQGTMRNRPYPVFKCSRKKERKQTIQGRDGRTRSTAYRATPSIDQIFLSSLLEFLLESGEVPVVSREFLVDVPFPFECGDVVFQSGQH